MSGADERDGAGEGGQIRGQTHKRKRAERGRRCGRKAARRRRAQARGGTRVSCLRIFLVIFSVYLYCPLFIQCPSVLHDRVCPSFYFRFSFFLRLGPCVSRLSPSLSSSSSSSSSPPPPPSFSSLRGEMHAFVHTCISVPPLTPPPIYSKRCLRSR